MNYNPKFSICIPNYNYGNYIEATIKSVLDQSFQDFEIIVSDNKSTDNSLEKIRAFKDDRIKIIENNTNVGFAPNLQIVTQRARGNYINLLSSDDIMCKNALEMYSKVIDEFGEKSNEIIFFSDVYHIDSMGSVLNVVRRDINYYSRKSFYSESDYLKLKNDEYNLFPSEKILERVLKDLRAFAPFLSIIYSKKMWEKVEGYNALRFVGPDFWFNLKILAESKSICCINSPLFKYRDHQTLNDVSQNSNMKQQIDDYLNTLEISNSLLERFNISRDDLINTYVEKLSLNRSLSYFSQGLYLQAVKIVFFSIATYPKQTLFRLKLIPIIFFILIGPLSYPISKLSKFFLQSFYKNS
tara:strand:- start:6165 stop:7229 length:1065 start_codon:yes stop_codon:yes gene_type:complete